MNTVYFRLWNDRTKLWYRDSIDTEDFDEAFEHFNWFSAASEDDDITEARVSLVSDKGSTLCRYTKSENPVW